MMDTWLDFGEFLAGIVIGFVAGYFVCRKVLG